MRGIGKTHVAAAYARSVIAEGQGVVGWVNAESDITQVTGLARIADRLGVADPNGDSAESARRLREHLITRPGPNLIVFDNAHAPDSLRIHLPSFGTTRVVITSTDRQFAEIGIPIDIDEFTRAESIAYLSATALESWTMQVPRPWPRHSETTHSPWRRRRQPSACVATITRAISNNYDNSRSGKLSLATTVNHIHTTRRRCYVWPSPRSKGPTPLELMTGVVA
jgi:hypothetical protein